MRKRQRRDSLTSPSKRPTPPSRTIIHLVLKPDPSLLLLANLIQLDRDVLLEIDRDAIDDGVRIAFETGSTPTEGVLRVGVAVATSGAEEGAAVEAAELEEEGLAGFRGEGEKARTKRTIMLMLQKMVYS